MCVFFGREKGREREIEREISQGDTAAGSTVVRKLSQAERPSLPPPLGLWPV